MGRFHGAAGGHGVANGLADAARTKRPGPPATGPWANDDYMIAYFKVLECRKRGPHDWSDCPYVHPNERARRRSLGTHRIDPIPCPDTEKGRPCPRGEGCTFAHNLWELWMHPKMYRTVLCRDGHSCSRRTCFFAHCMSELRQPSDTLPAFKPLPVAPMGAAAAPTAGAGAGGLPLGLAGCAGAHMPNGSPQPPQWPGTAAAPGCCTAAAAAPLPWFDVASDLHHLNGEVCSLSSDLFVGGGRRCVAAPQGWPAAAVNDHAYQLALAEQQQQLAAAATAAVALQPLQVAALEAALCVYPGGGPGAGAEASAMVAMGAGGASSPPMVGAVTCTAAGLLHAGGAACFNAVGAPAQQAAAAAQAQAAAALWGAGGALITGSAAPLLPPMSVSLLAGAYGHADPGMAPALLNRAWPAQLP